MWEMESSVCSSRDRFWMTIKNLAKSGYQGNHETDKVASGTKALDFTLDTFQGIP